LVLYPTLDDYVFLKAVPENKKYLSRQTDLGIYFLKSKKGELETVLREEIKRMQEGTTEQIEDGVQVLIVEGYCSNMEGVVLESNEDELFCRLKGWQRTYDVWIPRSEAVYKEDDEKSTDETQHPNG